MATHPTDEQVQALMQGPAEGSIRMINLLKFKAKAEYEDGNDGDCANGMEAYLRCAAVLHLMTVSWTRPGSRWFTPSR